MQCSLHVIKKRPDDKSVRTELRALFRPNMKHLLENTGALAQIWDLYVDLKNKQYPPSLSIDFEEWRDCKK